MRSTLAIEHEPNPSEARVPALLPVTQVLQNMLSFAVPRDAEQTASRNLYLADQAKALQGMEPPIHRGLRFAQVVRNVVDSVERIRIRVKKMQESPSAFNRLNLDEQCMRINPQVGENNLADHLLVIKLFDLRHSSARTATKAGATRRVPRA